MLELSHKLRKNPMLTANIWTKKARVPITAIARLIGRVDR
jgi:hypothetical protein